MELGSWGQTPIFATEDIAELCPQGDQQPVNRDKRLSYRDCFLMSHPEQQGRVRSTQTLCPARQWWSSFTAVSNFEVAHISLTWDVFLLCNLLADDKVLPWVHSRIQVFAKVVSHPLPFKARDCPRGWNYSESIFYLHNIALTCYHVFLATDQWDLRAFSDVPFVREKDVGQEGPLIQGRSFSCGRGVARLDMVFRKTTLKAAQRMSREEGQVKVVPLVTTWSKMHGKLKRDRDPELEHSVPGGKEQQGQSVCGRTACFSLMKLNG